MAQTDTNSSFYRINREERKCRNLVRGPGVALLISYSVSAVPGPGVKFVCICIIVKVVLRFIQDFVENRHCYPYQNIIHTYLRSYVVVEVEASNGSQTAIMCHRFFLPSSIIT